MINNKESYTFKKYLKNKKLIKFFYLFLIIDTIFFFYFLMNFYYSACYKYPLLATVIVFFFLVVFKFQIEKTDKELEEGKRRNYFTWGRGAGAELIVKRSLMTLNDDYRIISDFQTGKWNIDHICVGPTGIFAIEVKAHKGIMYCVGDNLKRYTQDVSIFLGQAKAESLFINHLIKEKLGKNYFVVPILVFPNTKIDISISHAIDNVWVGGHGFEKWIIENCKNKLNSEEIEKICNILR